MPSASAIWLVEPDEARVTVWSRTQDGGWESTDCVDETAELPVLDRTVRLGALYETQLT